MTEAVQKAPRRITGWTVFYGMVAFFGVIIAVNLTFVYFALDSWPGLTTQHAYEEGIAYNKTLEQAAAQLIAGEKGLPQLGHQLVDLSAGHRELI